MKCLAVQSRLVPLLSLAFFCVVWTCGSLCAQPTASDAPPATRTESGDLIRGSDFKFRLEDENGNLVAVPGFTLEKFLELLAVQNRLKDQQAAPPKVTFTGSIELNGQVNLKQQFARLDVTFRIRLTPRVQAEGEAWTAIPLRLDSAFLDVGAIEHKEEGEIYVTRDEASYVCWLRAAPDSTHTIRVPIKVPVRRTGQQDSFSLTLPNMATSMTLTVDDAMIDAFSPSGRSNVSQETVDDATIITVEGGGGELDIAWQRHDTIAPHALEATSATTVHVHGNLIWSEAQLKVRSRAEPIDSFIARLPEGMELTSTSDANFQISLLPSSDGAAPQRVLVKRLAGPTRGLIETHLEATFPPLAVESQLRTVQLAGYSVEDAVREWGSVDVVLDGSWLPSWQAGQFVQRVAVVEDPARQPPIAARFLYDRQPYSLRLELRPKKTPVAFETTYVVDVSDTEVKLDARINYSTSNAKTDSLSFKMPGWTVDAVTPPDALTKPFSFDDQGVLTLPINADATEIDLHVLAHRAIEQSDIAISFDLPRPTESDLLPDTTLIVLASDNVELTPELGAMKWLIQETRTSTLDLPTRMSAPLLFREELSAEVPEAAHFAASWRVRPRETTVIVASEAAKVGDMLQVHQTFLATVAYAPLAELPIVIPKSVVMSKTLRVTSDERELSYRVLSSEELVPVTEAGESAGNAASSTEAAIVSLPAPITGEIQLEMTFDVPLADLINAAGLQIPLVQPAGVEATENVTNTLTLRSDEELAFTLADEMWTLQSDVSLPMNGTHELRIRSTGVASVAAVQTSIVETRRNGNTSIARVWIQSWLTTTDRRDRVCFQLHSDQPLVDIQLPPDADRDQLRVLVDGQPPMELANLGDGSLTVTLTDEQVGRIVGLDLWYLTETSRNSRFGVAIPTIVDADRAERVYWQIVLPRSEHLAWTPVTLTSELVWQRDQWYWGRRGRLEQKALEELVGASTQESVPLDTNRYLFSSTGSVESVGFVKVSRLMLLMVSSGLALVTVLPFIYLPSLRHPGVFFVVGVMLFGIAVTYPEHTAVIGQAGAIGLGLGILACAIQRLVGKTPATPIARRGSVYITPDSQPSLTPPRVAEGSSRATTATAPAHLQVARVEGDS
ncbi:MAG: hypothetical protein KDB05_07150 [Planctomycetales bacterium]|nr:hypothetical protein [Planctomycetales bacterium]